MYGYQLDIVDSVAGRFVGQVYVREQAFRIPENVFIFYLSITSDISICCMHIKQPQNKYCSIILLKFRGVIITVMPMQRIVEECYVVVCKSLLIFLLMFLSTIMRDMVIVMAAIVRSQCVAI